MYYNTKLKPHLFTLKTKLNGHEIKILVDGGSDYTIMSSTLLDKINAQNHGSVTLVIDAVAGCSTTAKAEIYSLVIPTREGKMNITGYRLANIPAKINKTNTDDIYQAWPNLNDENRKPIRRPSRYFNWARQLLDSCIGGNYQTPIGEIRINQYEVGLDRGWPDIQYFPNDVATRGLR